MTDETTPSMDYGREAPQPLQDPTPGMHYETVDVPNGIPLEDTRTIRIPGKVSEMYPEQEPADEEIKVKDLPDQVSLEYLQMFDKGQHDKAIAAIRQDLIDLEAPEGMLHLADYLADEYRAHRGKPAWERWARDMTLYIRRGVTARKRR